jgi:hypothetical protein
MAAVSGALGWTLALQFVAVPKFAEAASPSHVWVAAIAGAEVAASKRAMQERTPLRAGCGREPISMSNFSNNG